MAEFGIGFVGYGEFAEFSRHSWREIDEVDVVAAADLDESRNPGDLRFYGDWKQLLTDEDVDIVAIATPPSTHASMALEALEAGKHVWVEKPPAMTVEDLQKMLEASQRKGKMVAVDYMLRYNPVVLALKSVADENVLGKLQHVSVANYAYDGKLGPDHWFWDKSKSGGILVEHAVHFFDMVNYVWGRARPVRITAHGVSRQPGMEDKVEATVEYDDGLLGTHFHHFFRPWWFERQSFRFAFDLGEVDVEGWIPLTATVRAVVDNARHDRLVNIFHAHDVAHSPVDVDEVTAGGTNYPVDRMISFSVALTKPKMDVYADCLRSAITDVVRGIRTGESAAISLENVTDSIRIACAGRQFADDERTMEIR